MGSIYVLIEGEAGKSEHQFWDYVNDVIYNNSLVILPCSGLSNVINNYNFLSNKEIGKSSLFILAIDVVMDNPYITGLIGELKERCRGIKNTSILNLICFEDTLLSFTYLVNWLFSVELRNNDKETIEKCKLLSEYKQLTGDKTGWVDNKKLKTLLLGRKQCTEKELSESIETLSYALLNHVTQRTKFRYNKGNLGGCFYLNCKSDKCYLIRNTYAPKTCGLWENNKLHTEKIYALYMHSELNRAIRECKHYFLSNGYNLADILIVL